MNMLPGSEGFNRANSIVLHEAENSIEDDKTILLGWALRQIESLTKDASAVVSLRRFAERCAQRDHQPDEHIGSAKCVACEAEDALRAIPTDRVPGEGVIQVAKMKWDLAEGAVDLLEEYDGYRAGRSINSPTEFQDWRERVSSTIIEFDALRADQGGAAT